LFINELPQNLVKILAKDETFAKLLDTVKGLKVGQSIEGKVAEVLKGGKVLLDLNGQKVSVETSGNLVKGQSIKAKVETISPSVILKISPEKTNAESLTKNTTQKNSSEASVKITLSKSSNSSNSLATGDKVRLQLGQTAEGTATKILDSGKVRVRIGNAEVEAQLPAQSKPVRIGENVLVKATASKGGVSLQILNPENQTTKIDGTTLKSYLPAKQDMGKMLTNLESVLNKNPDLGKYKIDSDVVQRLKDTLKVLIPRTETTPDGTRLKEQVDRSGINYEAKVKQAVDEGFILDRKPILSKDLKGQLLELQGKLEKFLAKEGNQLPPTVQRTISETVQQVKLASDNIELQQLSNQLSKQEQNPLVLQIPDPLLPETRTAKLYIRDSEGEKGGKSGDKKDFHMVFLLNLSAIGDIRIDAKLNGTNLAADFSSENNNVVDLIKSGSADLQKKLEELGFSASVNSSVKEKTDMEMEDSTDQALKAVSTRLVDIKT
jgi:hypothetical protein